ncbi:malonyl-ACP O-methyltransferase BioC [Parahaliea maris]|uniref:Malonyl-[acyl-carrier protein] O-methyltransferase n=1 Tax=Parahaliea maris TaxID=2716870 RepID=A0A5C8ZSH5_9GAMM|nr:malonyl-ACP O-methyltransferase BioC [Parahaliea maris]TXS90704.1 malonyl-ACP O-methyltransferase BioC [Parahaliea maris]
MRPELICERLWANGEPRAELVLLHGWGSSRDCWRGLLASVRPWANVSLLELPGLGAEAAAISATELAARVAEACPEGAVLVGWSLGGQLATLAAAQAPERIHALVTLASNPHFTARGDWPGVDPAQLQQMMAAHRADPRRNLERFEALQSLGQSGAAGLRRSLAACRGTPEACGPGLDWLGQLDTRQALADLVQPQLHLLGTNDTLIPPALARALADCVAGAADASVESLPQAGHALPLQCPDAIGQRLRVFLEERGLLRPSPGGGAVLDKQAIAASFGRAASTYDSVAALQRDVGQRLLARIPPQARRVETVLDLGCGTAYFQPALEQRFPGASYLGLDLATGMLDYARRERGRSGCWVAGDAEQLPLASNSVDLVFSSLAIQWCQRPEALFAELARVLRPGGVCVVSTLGPATLHELRSAWAAVDGERHVNDFLPATTLAQAAFALQGGLDWQLEHESLCLQYRHLRELFAELKGIGAHNVHSERSAGLGGRRALAGMMAAYEAFREGDFLPATYEVYYGLLSKSASGAREEAA